MPRRSACVAAPAVLTTAAPPLRRVSRAVPSRSRDARSRCARTSERDRQRVAGRHRQFLVTQVTEQNSKLAEIDRQLAQKEAERETVAASISKLEATIPLLQERVEVRKYLYSKELGSKIIYLTELQDLVGQQHDLQVQKSKYREADAAVATLEQTRLKTAAEYRRNFFDELAKAEQKVGRLAQDVVKAQERTKLQLLTAPVDGVVQQLAVHTVGGW